MDAFEPLLATKLGVQDRGRRHLTRARLRDALERETSGRLVLVSAPAGFGKSSLLSDWLTRSGRPFAWLALDASDNDPTRFLRYLLEATRSLGGAPRLHGDRDAPGPPTPDVALTRVVAMLAEQPDGAVLVLDDYHRIAEPTVHAIVGRLVERLPPRARLAIATRSNPPLPLARLRARGELLEIRADALRFTRDEAAAFLAGPMELDLQPGDVDELTARTEGWAAVLQLAALSLRGRADTARLIREFGASNRFLLDFVVEEVLANLPPDVQEFLLRTSILERLTGPLCDALTGQTDGGAVLARLEQANLLLFPLDQERRWYRYHQLFADLLRARLAMRDPELPGRMHEQAAGWLEGHGMVGPSIEHALAAADPGRARRLIREQWMVVMHRGELRTVERWLDAMPGDMVRADPQLGATYAWGLVLRRETGGVADRLEVARRALAGGKEIAPADRQLVPPQLELLEAKLAELVGDPAAEIAHAQAAIASIPAGVGTGFDELLRGDALNLVGQGRLLQGDDEGAADAFREALPLLRRTGNAIGVSHGVRDLVRIELRAGRPGAALELASTLVPGAERGVGGLEGGEPVAAAALHVARAEALLALGKRDAARESAMRARSLAADSGDGSVLSDAGAILERLDAKRPPRSGAGDGLPGSRAASALVEPLTPREMEVLRLVAAGRSNRQIAADLFVTLGTVKAHVHAVCGKLAAGSRVQAIVRGRELGILD